MTVKVFFAARPTPPLLFVARTWKVCLPFASFCVVKGEVQLANWPLSTLHLKVTPLPEALNLNVGVLSVVFDFGPLVIVVAGQGCSGGVAALFSGFGVTSLQSPGL